MEDLGLDLLAIYHSHPDTESYPSAVDVAKAYFTETLYIIISLKGPTPGIRGFRIARSGEITEEKFEIL
jgi:proteasome lid subunit RPN8/RPN11